MNKLFFEDEHQEKYARWLNEKMQTDYKPALCRFFGIENESEIIGVVCFERNNGFTMFVHAAAKQKGWLSDEFKNQILSYVFEQSGIKYLVASISAENKAAIKKALKIGFYIQAALPNASKTANDLHFYYLTSQRWKKHG